MLYASVTAVTLDRSDRFSRELVWVALTIPAFVVVPNDRGDLRYMVLDQRTQKSRRTSYKLIVRDIEGADLLTAG